MRISLPDVLIRILILQWISKEDTPYFGTFFTVDTKFAKPTFAITAATFKFSFFHILFRATIVSFY